MNSIGWMYLLYAAVFILLVVLVPPLIKRFYYQRLMRDLQEQNFKTFNRHIDSFLAKIAFSAFEREAMRLTMFELRGEKKEADELIQFMEHMRLSRKQRVQLGERGFYVYLSQGKVKKARHMLDLVKEYGSEQQVENLEIQYSILLKKESRYIDAIKERLERLKDAGGNIPAGLETNAGTYEYLIGLQYYYKKDHKNMKEWLNQALEHLQDTPYEGDIQKMLQGSF